MWCRSGVPTQVLVQIAQADAYSPSLRLERRDTLCVIRPCLMNLYPLFAAAAEREMATIAEQQEPEVALRQMISAARCKRGRRQSQK
ncbi:hypothetical protein CPJ18_22800 [Agrobacterium rosae]|uniref:Uncharacterized protein n=1 Tax=Agrobacterium rosae TaxID=1972867 RepID=A0AAE5RTH4_9HYPH|nr:hypothetical protein DXM21_22865 [Agrobacterium rosae]KAA3513950.1 hypothetical protein DXM25_23055 [Agrobacterium rosae]MQB50975.1 hypothetical protein [Agrobacterium rosae]POO48819.1 hypothetical protein CPJ18_22800 [Agrobacterium rosae]